MAKKLTLKSLGHVEEGDRFRLSDSYAHSRDNFKVVEKYVIGYTVVGDGHRAPVRIAPIYRATIWSREKKRRNIATSYEVGEYLNPPGANQADFFLEDQVANAVAMSVMISINALLHRQEERKEHNNAGSGRTRNARGARAPRETKDRRTARRPVGDARRKGRRRRDA